MDVDYSKQAVSGIAAPKRKSVTVLRDTTGSQNGTPQLCNRIGCCGRLNNTKVTKNKCIEKPKASKPSFRSSSIKEVTGSSSKTSSSIPNLKKPLIESEKKISFKIERIPKESTRVTSVPKESGIQERKLKSRTTEVASSSSSSSSSRIKKVYSQSGSSIMENSESESNNGRRRRFLQGESSSSVKGKRVIGVSANEGRPVVSTSGISVSVPKSSRNWTPSKANGVSSVRTRRSLKMESSKESVDLSSVNSVDGNPETSHAETLSSSTDTETSSTMLSLDSNGTRHFNLDGIADVLLALDRIEQNEELTYEQLLSLEANLFLGGLNLFDQHRDMRLDIDNMSYEELLALEEKMGTVSTALSEEELSKCIRKSVYESVQLEDGRMTHNLGADDSKCSICQEEFVNGDEIGRLGCKHGYHNTCINQWLHMKNWCPICKSSPKPSSSHS